MTRYRKKPVEVEAWHAGKEPSPDWIVSAQPVDDGKAWDVVTTIMPCGIRTGDFLILYGDDTIGYCPECTFRATYEPVPPYYEEVYDWAFNGMECCDGYEFEMFSKIADAIAEYRRQAYEVVG